MKEKKENNSSDSEDYALFQQIKDTKTKNKISNLPLKRILPENDGKKTMKYKDDAIMNSIF